MKLKLLHLTCALSLAGASLDGTAAVNYISASAGGYMLHMAGDAAIVTSWGAQSPVQGFSGYGQIHLAGRCLTGKLAGQQLRWEGCRGGDKSQVWSLTGGTLVNELAVCAEVEAAAQPEARVVGVGCSGSANQRWKTHAVQSVHSFAGRINDASLRALFISTVRAAAAGTFISVVTGKVVPSSVAASTPAGALVISAGGGNLIASEN